jgi:hypothetical protein
MSYGFKWPSFGKTKKKSHRRRPREGGGPVSMSRRGGAPVHSMSRRGGKSRRIRGGDGGSRR